MRRKNSRYIKLLIFSILVVTLVLFLLFNREIKGQGEIVSINNGCAADGICSLEVKDGNRIWNITTNAGWGACENPEDSFVFEVGDYVDYYARKVMSSTNYASVCDNEKYYISNYIEIKI
jgi:hypothetical protein